MIRETLGRAYQRAKRLPRAQRLRYWYAVHFGQRDYYSFTQFLRLPTQYEALVGPVLAHFGDSGYAGPLRIVVIGCSTGAEPYSIATVLLKRRPELAFRIDAYDIAHPLLEQARRGEYTEREVRNNVLLPPSFVEEMFEEMPDRFVVRASVAERVTFHHGDVLDNQFVQIVGPADIVYAQNILFNLPRFQARAALANIARLLKPSAAVFLDGTDLDMRKRFARIHRLQPLDFKVQRIHDEAHVIRGPRWPYSHTGLEPFNSNRNDRSAYYSTIFLKGVPCSV